MSTAKAAVQQTERHESLWYEDGNLVLQTQNMVFKVHRGVLARQSSFFQDLLSLPVAVGTEREQEGTESQPLLLHDVSATSFSDLLKMLYNVWGSDFPLSDDEFVEVLLTAQRLLFGDVLEIVLRILDTRLPAVRKLQLGLECDFDFWKLRAFQELVVTFKPPASEDKPRLSDSVWLKVLSARTRISQARMDHLLKTWNNTCGSVFCGHVLAVLLRSVAISGAANYKPEYSSGVLGWKYHCYCSLGPGTKISRRFHECFMMYYCHLA